MKSTKSVITGLTVNQENFAQYLAKGYDNPTAYTKAFGLQTCTRKSLLAKAHRIANKREVLQYIEQLRDETRARGAIDRDEMIDWLKNIAEFGMGTQRRSNKYDTWEEMKDSSGANSAIDKILKIGGLYAAEKIETEHKVKGKFILNLKQRTDASV